MKQRGTSPHKRTEFPAIEKVTAQFHSRRKKQSHHQRHVPIPTVSPHAHAHAHQRTMSKPLRCMSNHMAVKHVSERLGNALDRHFKDKLCCENSTGNDRNEAVCQDSDVIFQTKIQRKGKRRDLDVEEDGPEEEEGSQYVLPFEVLPQGFARSVREEFNRLSQSEEGREQVEFAYERSRRVDKAS